MKEGRKKKFAAQFITFCILFITSINAQTLTPEQIFTKVDKSVVVVLSLSDDDEIAAQGSGVVFDKKGLVATNFHIINDGTKIVVKHYDKIIKDVEIVGFDAQKDILILKIPENLIPPINTADVSTLQPGQRIYAIGCPLGLENTISEGLISGLRYWDELGREYIQITASISSGSSGGAVVNTNGELIGISTASLKEGQNLNFAIKISEFTSIKIGTKNKLEIDYGNLFSLGVSAIDVGEYFAAIKIYDDYLSKNPKDAKAYYNRGNAKDNLEDHRGALQDYTKAIEINPKDAKAYYNRGIAKVLLNDKNGACLDWSKAGELGYMQAYDLITEFCK